MPNRVLRDYTNSEKVNKLSFNAEVFFVRLMMKADDYGRFYGNETLLKSNLFPFKVDNLKDSQISKWIEECANADLIEKYLVDGRKYVQIKNFGQRLRLMVSKFPENMTAECQHNDGQYADISQQDDSSVTARNEKKQKRSRNETESESEKVEIYPTFNDFWDLYDKKVDKEISQKKWSKLSQAEKEKCLIHIEYYKQFQPDPKFRKSPATYLNQKMFNDDIQPIPQNGNAKHTGKNQSWGDFFEETLLNRQANSGSQQPSEN